MGVRIPEPIEPCWNPPLHDPQAPLPGRERAPRVHRAPRLGPLNLASPVTGLTVGFLSLERR